MYKQVAELEEGDILILKSGDVVIKRHVTKVTGPDNYKFKIVHKLTPDSESAGVNTLNGDAFIEVANDATLSR